MRYLDKVRTDLIADTVAYEINQWYDLSIITENGHIQVFVDSAEVFSIIDSTFLSGKAGLYCHGNQSSYWDNFEITNLDFLSSIEPLLTGSQPEFFRLYQNYPNPFNPVTTIRYVVGAYSNSPHQVDLSVYNIIGQKMATLVSEPQKAGTYQVQWDATGLPTGVYLYRLSTDRGYVETRKLILMK
jgi:hypothetical protein